VLAGAAALLLLVVVADLAFPPPIPAVGAGSTLVGAADGTPLRAFPAADGVWRYPVDVDEVSPLYLEALLGYEDRWFDYHPGVNPLALLRAAAQALRYGEIVSGGSTLTMQVARLIEPIPRSGAGKLKQMLRALQLERRLSKREILALYLNHAPFGGNIAGVQAASFAYLGKPARELSHAEAALLAVLPQAPSRLRPDRHPEAARDARDKVLGRLRDLAIWPASALAESALEPVTARRLVPPLSAPLLAQRLRDATPAAGVITTTVIAGVQQVVERRTAAHAASLPPQTSVAVLVLRNADAATLAYVGSARFGDADSLGHVDMVRARRSPGSTLKPFVYGLALDDGLIHAGSLLVDAPRSFGGYRPANFGMQFHGPVRADDALRLSLNVPAVDLLERITPQRLGARLAHAGLALSLPRGAEPNLAIVLGGAATSLEELVGAYRALGARGLAARPRLRADDPLDERALLGEDAAWIVREMLAGGGRPGEAVQGLDASGRVRVAWKTGTSYGFRDSWAVGVTASYTIGVWIGRPDGTPQPGQYGAITALPLLFALADALPRSAADLQAPVPPSGVREVDICWPSGTPAADLAPELCHQRQAAWTLGGAVPPTLPDLADPGAEGWIVTDLVDARGRRAWPQCADGPLASVRRARWPTLALPWLPNATRTAAAAPALAPACATLASPAAHALAITGALPGSILRRAPGSATPPVLALRAVGAEGEVDWLVNGRLVGRSAGDTPLVHRFDAGGEQQIVAIDSHGRYDALSLSVAR
jgi:penicillin-binding protein 1C